MEQRSENFVILNTVAKRSELGHSPPVSMNTCTFSPIIQLANVEDKYKCITDISLAVINTRNVVMFLSESLDANKERDLIL